MNDFKRKLDQMMGDTSAQEQRIRQRVYETNRPPARRPSWKVAIISAALPALAVLLFFSFDPFNQLSADQGPGTPYDPLDDLAQISALQKKKQLSDIKYDELADLPYFDQVDGLYYVDREAFTAKKSTGSLLHTVIERKANVYDGVVYQAGDVVRTMTDTTSHLPTYDDVYYEVIAVPGDRVILEDGNLKINGRPLRSDLMESYKKQGVTIAGGYDQVLNAREYLLLNHFPANGTVQGATITPVHKILGQVAGVAAEGSTDSIYLDYLAGDLAGEYPPEQTFDLCLYDALFGGKRLPQTAAFANVSRVGELFVEASYRKAVPSSDDQVEVRYQYGHEGVADRVFSMTRGEQGWMIEE